MKKIRKIRILNLCRNVSVVWIVRSWGTAANETDCSTPAEGQQRNSCHQKCYVYVTTHVLSAADGRRWRPLSGTLTYLALSSSGPFSGQWALGSRFRQCFTRSLVPPPRSIQLTLLACRSSQNVERQVFLRLPLLFLDWSSRLHCDLGVGSIRRTCPANQNFVSPMMSCSRLCPVRFKVQPASATRLMLSAKCVGARSDNDWYTKHAFCSRLVAGRGDVITSSGAGDEPRGGVLLRKQWVAVIETVRNESLN